MTRREAGFLLIGLGAGLIFAAAAVIYLIFGFHRTFILGFHWRPGSIVLAIPFLCMLFGAMLLYREKN